ncbi:AzlD domain-containing protein [Pseudomonas sp. Z1-29]|uniref:AzlD domain-containing protein n=1 Tax=Pseudomonas sp. Z1-29 TaxID=2817410 RepID=UPI003DA94D1E
MFNLIARREGVFVMSFVPISYRVQQFISAMSGSILIAVLTPLAVTGGNGARLALLMTGIITLVSKKPLPAIAAGIAVAALWRNL